MLIVDIRFPVLHFPPAFYKHCTEVLDRDIILVLNKIDLVPTSVVIAWKHYFKQKYPKLHVLLFSSSKQIKLRKHKQEAKLNKENTLLDEDEQAAIKSAAAKVYTAKAHRHLYECVRSIVGSHVDLNSWADLTEQLISESTTTKIDEDKDTDDNNIEIAQEDALVMDDLLNSRKMRKRFENGFVTIGCCGFPNVGKSSLLNSLKGRKVVSVSKTPGHTKHLQTIFLTKQVRLCDCPGLVFPSLVCKPLQVIEF